MMITRNGYSIEYIYRTLKPIMDKSATALRILVETGQSAEHEQSVIYRQMSDLQYCIMNNRHDRETVRDAERDLFDYEYQVCGINKKIAAGKSAAKQLSRMSKFYQNYDKIIVAPKLALLKQERDAISDKMDALSERIFACNVNMDASERSPDVVVQSANDMLIYENEYAQLAGRLATVCGQIKKLRQK